MQSPSKLEGLPKVFISYSRRDLDFADRVDQSLKKRGFSTLIDRTEIYAFEDWWKRIENLIVQADAVVFVVSPDAVASDVCQREVAFAGTLNKRLAPIVFRRVDAHAVPAELSRLNFILFDDAAAFDAAADRLAEALATDIDWVRRHTEFGTLAKRWSESAGNSKRRALLLRSPQLEEAESWISTRPHGAQMPTDATQAFVAESRRATTNRRRRLTVALSSGLVVALLLAAVALWQREEALNQRNIAETQSAEADRQRGVADARRAEAERERATAQRNFESAKTVADDVVTEVTRNLVETSGLQTAIARTLLKGVEKAYDRLKSEDANPELEISRAAMLATLANTYEKMGDNAEQTKAVLEALDIMRRLVSQDPAQRRFRQSLMVTLGAAARALAKQGRHDKALEMFREGLAVAQVPATPATEPAESTKQRALLHMGASQSLFALGNISEAQDEARIAIGIGEAIPASDPDRAQWQTMLSGIQATLGGPLPQTSSPRREEPKTQSSVSAPAASQDPSKSIDRGDELRERNKLADALAAYRQGLDLSTQLSRVDPQNVRWKEIAAAAQRRIGDILRRQGDLPGAVAATEKSLALTEQLVAMNERSPVWVSQLSVIYRQLAQIRTDQKRPSEAVDAFRLALKAARRLVALEPDNPLRLVLLFQSTYLLGDSLAKTGNDTEALATLIEALKVARNLAAGNLMTQEIRLSTAITLWRLADLGNEPVPRRQEVINILRQLKAEGAWSPSNERFLQRAEESVAKGTRR